MAMNKWQTWKGISIGLIIIHLVTWSKDDNQVIKIILTLMLITSSIYINWKLNQIGN